MVTRKWPLARRFQFQADAVDLCRGTGVENKGLAANCAYFILNLPTLHVEDAGLSNTLNSTVVWKLRGFINAI